MGLQESVCENLHDESRLKMYQNETAHKSQNKFRNVLLIISGALLVGCGKFQTHFGEEFNGLTTASSSIQSPNAKIATSDGSIGWVTDNLEKSINLNIEMKVPFGRVYRSASKIIKWTSPLACQPIDGVETSSPDKYRDGEIPCGSVNGSNQKEIMQISVPGMNGKKEGFDYNVSGITLPILLDRNQKSGSYSEASLDSKSTVSRQSSTQFAEDLSIRFVPSGESSRWEICANVPGTVISSQKTKVSAGASRNFGLFKAKFSASFNVDLGQASFDYARSCLAADFKWGSHSLQPELATSVTVNPYLSGAHYSGLNIHINDWFLRLADDVMNFFHSSLRQSAQKKIVSKANNLLDADVKTGIWFTKIHGENIVESLGRRATELSSRLFTRIGVPATGDQLKQMVVDSCARLKISGGEKWTANIQRVCTDVIQRVNISVEPFSVDVSSKEKGCYQYFARIHDSKDSSGHEKWWSNECQFRSTAKIQIPIEFESYVNEIKLLLANRFVLDRLPDEVEKLFSKWNLDEYSLLLVFEALESRGLRLASADQLNLIMPTILSNIQNKVVQNSN